MDNARKHLYAEDEEIMGRIARTEELLGDKGRVLVRVSGTEPLVRIMLEGESEEVIDREAAEIARMVAEKFQGEICGR